MTAVHYNYPRLTTMFCIDGVLKNSFGKVFKGFNYKFNDIKESYFIQECIPVSC